ncbi:nucleoside hydrolase [Brachybacterium sp. NBEC-018]|uniref:nucleoside hydrolase n=1 Tax=Brachybacterium sp. NBEC-018 TaxID=2996004 RepID=UPI002174E8CB|nr:nucleoside hydrolase [Brachybacterium sp. NBEC-018]UVY84517.1 nucleoside hydrolase [Brachybacterium sp. NBEC-018]
MTRIPRTPSPAPAPRRWRPGETPWATIDGVAAPAAAPPSARVIVDNDFAGDPDDLYQLVHHLLSPAVTIPLVVGSRLREGDGFYPGADSATQAAAIARDVMDRMGCDAAEIVVAGSNTPLPDRGTPQPSSAAAAIIDEALREDTGLPLFYAAGGGLTDLATALLLEPRIAERMTLLWIGGNEHPELAAPPPGGMPIEYNLLIDVNAAQVVFTDSALPIWQIPRDVYRQCLVSSAELRRRVAATGPVGRYLHEETRAVVETVAAHGHAMPETYALGDSPLVLLTALRSAFEPDSASSRHVVVPTPALEADGTYTARPDARPMRIYTQVDTRLMFEDLFTKLAELDAWLASA